MTLALLIVLDHEIDPDVRYLIAFHVSGIVLLTTLINGSITEWIYGRLSIDAPSKFDAELAVSVLQTLEHGKIDPTVAKLGRNWFYHDAEWRTVLSIVPDLSKVSIVHGRVSYDRSTSMEKKRESVTLTLRKNIMMHNMDGENIGSENNPPGNTIGHVPEAERNFQRFEDDYGPVQSTISGNRLSPADNPNRRSDDGDDAAAVFESDQDQKLEKPAGIVEPLTSMEDEREEKVRCVFLTSLKANYDHQFARGYFDSRTREGLMEAADVGLESGPASFRHTSRFPTDIPSSQKILHQWQTLEAWLPDPSHESTIESILPTFGKSGVLDGKLLRIVSTLSAFVHGTTQVLGNLSAMFSGPEDIPYISQLAEEVSEVNEYATDMLDELQARYPKRLVLVKTIKAAEYLLRLERELIHVNTERGLIPHAVSEQLCDLLERTMKKLADAPFHYVKQIEHEDHVWHNSWRDQRNQDSRLRAREDIVDLESVRVSGSESSDAEDMGDAKVHRRRSRMRVNDLGAVYVESSSDSR